MSETKLATRARVREWVLPGWAWGCGWCRLESHAFVMDPNAKTRDGEQFEGLMPASRNYAAALVCAALKAMEERG